MLTLTTEALNKMTSDQVRFLKLYELDYNPPNAPAYFAKWDVDVSYNGNVYTPIPIKDSGIKQNSDGELQPMTLTVGNIDNARTIQTYIEQYGLIGKKVKRIKMFQNINDPIENTFIISGAKAKKGVVTLTLSIGFDAFNATLPNRTVYQRFCRWQKSEGFKGTECKYSGSDTSCKFNYEDCKSKGNLANFGGFPGVTNQHFFF